MERTKKLCAKKFGHQQFIVFLKAFSSGCYDTEIFGRGYYLLMKLMFFVVFNADVIVLHFNDVILRAFHYMTLTFNT